MYAVMLIADIIGSKAMASKPGGHTEIRDLCDCTGAYLDRMLRTLAGEPSPNFRRLDPEGDNVVYRLEAETAGELANLALSSAIAAFLDGPAPTQFRYVIFHIDPVATYQPRIKAFNEVPKSPDGKNHYLAADRALVSVLSDREIFSWLRDVPTKEARIKTPGEATAAVYVDFYCPIRSEVVYPPLAFLKDSVLRGYNLLSTTVELPRMVAAPDVHVGSEFVAITDTASPPRTHELKVLTERGEVHLARGQLVQARESFRSGLEQYEALSSALGQAQMLTNLGRVDQAAGNAVAAEAYYQAALRVNIAAGLHRGEAIALTHLASLLEKTDPPRAREALLRAVKIEEALGPSLALIYAANSAGRLLRRIRELDTATAMFNMAVKAATATRHYGLACRNLGDLGTAYRDLGDIPKARAAYDESLGLAEKWGFSWAAAIVHDNLGRLEAIVGNEDLAEAHFTASLRLDRSNGDAFGMAKSYANIGVLHWLRGSTQKACDAWKASDDLFRRSIVRGGRIEAQANDFLRKLTDIRERTDRVRRRGANLNDLFF